MGLLFAGHLDPVAASLRSRHALGEQLVWGDAAAGIAAALSAVATAPGAPPIRTRADELIGALPHGIARLGRWEDTVVIPAPDLLPVVENDRRQRRPV